MKKHLFISIACLLSVSALAGCGTKQDTATVPTTAAEEITTEIETTAKVTELNPAEDTVTTKETSSELLNTQETQESSESAASNAELPLDAQSMLECAHALALCDTELHANYAVTDDAFFWNAASYLMSGYGMQSAAADIDEEGILSLPSSYVKEFAAALFADYDGNTAPLPDIPDSVNLITYQNDTEHYRTALGSFNSTKITQNGCLDNGDGSFTLSFSLAVDDTETNVLGNFRMTIAPTAYTGSGHPLFHYSITSFEKIS